MHIYLILYFCDYHYISIYRSASNISKSMDSDGWIIIDFQKNEIESEVKTNDPMDLIDTDWEVL